MKTDCSFIELILASLLLLSGFISAARTQEAPEVEWSMTFDGYGSDTGNSVQQTSDGGYIVAGKTSANYGDLLLIKTDADGNQVWLRTFGGEGMYSRDEGFCVQQTRDGGYIVTGYRDGGTYCCYKLWLLKTDADGNLEWERTFGVGNQGYSVKQTSDFGYIVSGVDWYYRADLLIKTNSMGEEEWVKIFSGISNGANVELTADGGYIVAGTRGYVDGTIYYDARLIKTDADGKVEWEKTYNKQCIDPDSGEESPGDDSGGSVQQTSDGGYILTGITHCSFGFYNWVIKTDANGDKIWDKNFEHPRSIQSNVQQTTDGGYIIAGYFYAERMWLGKLDSEGHQLWEGIYPGWYGCYGANGCLQSNDGGYVIVGQKGGIGGTDVWLVKLKPDFPANQPPVADAGYAYTSDEGFPITLDASNSYDPDGDVLQYHWDFNNDGHWDTGWLDLPTISHLWCDDYAGAVVVEVSDGHLTDTATANVTVNNVAPTISSIAIPLEPVNINDMLNTNVVVNFSDPAGSNDEPYTCYFDYNSDGMVDESVEGIAGTTCSGTPDYTEPGVYIVSVTVTDKDGGTSSSTQPTDYIVIYNPEDGFVTGGGWIDSPEGAYIPDSTLTGKANFGFVSKYKKGATVPTGNTEFSFKAGDLNFHSDEYDWLVVNQDDSNAQYKGKGTINGESADNGDLYRFMLWAADHDPDGDTFRIKIWYEESEEAENLVYDNGFDQVIGGGNIKIHTGAAAAPAAPSEFVLLHSYPNPFNPDTWIPYQLAEDVGVAIRIYDAAGHLIRTLNLGHKPAGFYVTRVKAAYWDGKNEAGELVSSGVYFYIIQAGEFTATKKMVVRR